jgi:MtrB/PioB family decaheme-associated outer membrane protein
MALSSLVSGALADSEAVQPEINEVEIGAGYVSDDSYRFGRYTGLEEEGAYIIGDVKARQYRDDAYNWRLRGTNLGLDSRYLRLEGGKQGAQEVYIEYQKMPNYINDSGATPFSGAGSSNLTLPPGFDINTNLDQSLVGLDRETERERYGVGTSIIPRRLRNWNFRVAYQHETKQGTSAIGGSMGGSFPGLTGSTTAAILPQPIDYVTDLVDISLAYAKDRTQLEFAYHMSLFDNQDRSLDWQDPFAPSRFGSQALAPRNQFHQFTAKGGYQLAGNSRLTGVFSIGRMTQDWNYQAYATLPPGLDASLPRDSLDGEVWLKTARVDLTSRPMPRLRVNAAYRYHERDNDTSSATYDYFIADSTTAAIAPATNRPLSYRRHNLDLDASYRANQMVSLAGNLGFNGVRREYDNTDANDNDEYIAGARLKFYPNSELDAEVYAEHSRRDVSDYSNTPGVIPDFENPELRYYYIADRNRDRLGLRLSYMPYEKVTLGFNIDYNRDDYEDSDIGLTESKTTAYTWDIAYLPRANITTRAYYTVEKIKSDQAGSESGLPAPDWFADLEDRFITLGLGGEIRDIRGRVDLGMDYVFSKSTGEIDLSAEDSVSSAASLGQYPDLETILNSLKIYARYKHSETLTLKLSYWYQNYDADSWALDDVGPTSAPDTLLLGEGVQDYTVHLVAASAAYRF